MIPVEDVRAGDIVRLPSGAEHVVLRVEGPYADGTRVVVYAAFAEAIYESSGGLTFRTRASRGLELVVERGIRPLAAGELVPVTERGCDDRLLEAQTMLEELEHARSSGRVPVQGLGL